jgi:hypothetical protein
MRIDLFRLWGATTRHPCEPRLPTPRDHDLPINYQNDITPRIGNAEKPRDFFQATAWSALLIIAADIALQCCVQRMQDAPTLVPHDMQGESHSSPDAGKHFDLIVSPVNTMRESIDAKELRATNNDAEKIASSPPRAQDVVQADVIDWNGEDDPAKSMNW